MEAELFREINGRFLPNELGDPTFCYSQILGVSLEPCRRSICLIFQISFIVMAILRRFTVTLYFSHKNNAYISLPVITLLK